ncbi:zinc finger protein GIS2-like [Coccinella septempunctata]|uniref:zinc finger protein GIS2-like n=1 Tax=Coccinella septempunctata TaxID=41139 RepID=UPI001D061319|nr:zinc finger protein GIS2-like [Coccinella septempunctata]
MRTIDHVKQRFLDVDNRNCRQKHVVKRSFGERYDSRVKRPRTDGFKTRHDCDSRGSGDKKVKTPAELFKMQKVNLTDLYSNDEIVKLHNMTKEEKMQNRCGKCGTYFHKSSECKYNKKFCYCCHQFGHIVKDCSLEKKGKTMPQDYKEIVIEC